MMIVLVFVFTACTSQTIDNIEQLEEHLELNFIAKAIEALYHTIGNYGWTMVLITVILKIAMLPLDIWQRITTRKNTLQMQQMAPMIEAIDRKYANNPQKANEEKQKLYKKQGYSVASSCLPMIVTMTVFIVVFSGVNSYARHRNYYDYVQLSDYYKQVYSQTQSVEQAQQLTYQHYEQNVKESWLWIQNVQRPDTWEKPMADFSSFASSIGLNPNSANLGNFRDEYEQIRVAVVDNGYNGWNGWLILPLCCVGLSFLSIWLPQKLDKKRNGVVSAEQQQTNKTMMFMMPLMMAWFGFVYTGAFAIYITCNYALTLISTLAFRSFIEKRAQASAEKDQPKETYSYKRK